MFFLIDIGGNLIISAKLAIAGLLEIKAFWYKVYEVKIFVHYATIRILLREANHIVNVVMWPKFGKSGITIREVTITLIL